MTNVSLKKQEKSQINNLTLHHKELVKEKQKKAKISTRREITKIRAEINEIKTKAIVGGKSIKLRAAFFFRIIYLFIFGCVGSSFLCEGFL